MYQFPSGPQGIGGVLDGGFKLFSTSFKPVLGLVLMYAAVSAVSNGILHSTSMQTGPDGLPAFDIGPGYFIAIAVAMIANIVLYPAIVKRIDDVARGRQSTLGDALAHGVRRSGWFLLAGIVYAIAFAIGIVLLIVPGVIFGLSLVLGPYVIVVLERVGPLQSLADSHRLIWGNWWRTALMMTVLFIVIGVIYVIVGFVVGLLGAIGGVAATLQTVSAALDVFVAPLAMIVMMPIMLSVILAIYYDLKLRREGSDLAERIGQVEAT